MTDVAGLVIGVIATWKACVQVFDIIDSGTKYGMDYEQLRVKLEVERIRLLLWGDAVGLNELENGQQDLEALFNRQEVGRTVLRLLGCIQHVFEGSESFRSTYGLRKADKGILGRPDRGRSSVPSENALSPVFKRAYETLQESAKDRQRDTPLSRKTKWAIHDKKKFHIMLSEIKGFNDSLESLLPDAKRKASRSMRNEIDQSDDMGALQKLLDATSDQHEEISDTASVRLGVLEAASASRSQASRGARDMNEDMTTSSTLDVEEVYSGAVVRGLDPQEAELEQQMESVSLYLSKKRQGAVTISLIGPNTLSAQVTTRISWDCPDEESDEDRDCWVPVNRDLVKGFVPTTHASFGLYRRRKYLKTSPRNEDIPTDEDRVLLDVESNAKYENKNPGTVTVEGFAMECWDHELRFGRKRNETVPVSSTKLPSVKQRQLLRRIDELRRGENTVGRAPKREEASLVEFFGDMGTAYYRNSTSKDHHLGAFSSVMNRVDRCTDFTATSSVTSESLRRGRGDRAKISNFLRQVILAKELAVRLEHASEASISGFTPQTLASLIVQDLWLSNVQITIAEADVRLEDARDPESSREQAEAEDFKIQGNESFQNEDVGEAVDLYTEAIKISSKNAVYRARRSAALFKLGKYNRSLADAVAATQLDPKYANSWLRLGNAKLELGMTKQALKAYRHAIKIAGEAATRPMRQGLKDAKAKLDAETEAINKETDEEVRFRLQRERLNQTWDTRSKYIEVRSLVHDRQVDGLLVFAQCMKWPYINKTRDYAEDVYSNLCAGQVLPCQVYNWLYGMTLPGKWMSFNIMAALVLCSPSISGKLAAPPDYDCGLSLSKSSYWRIRTVVGRVLGCLPNTSSLCGWIGPCPPVKFVSSPSEDFQNEPHFIQLKARPVAPKPYIAELDEDVIDWNAQREQQKDTRLLPDDELPAYIEEMKDASKWVMPQPPVRELSTCTLQSIWLKKLALDIGIGAQRNNGELSDKDVEDRTRYRASVVFKMDNDDNPVTYTLYTNPIFVTVPPCISGPKGAHEVHMRELANYRKEVWTVEHLKDHKPGDDDGGVLIINATGRGAETVARSWCSDRGRNAVIRRAGGPCFVCAVRAAGRCGLDVGVLIWVS